MDTKWIVLFFVALLMLATKMHLSAAFGWFGCLFLLFLLWIYLSFC